MTDPLPNFDPSKVNLPPELQKFNEQQQAHIKQLIEGAAEARSVWLSNVLKKFMPDDLWESLEAVRRGEKRQGNIMERAKRWFEKHNVTQEAHPDHYALKIDGRTVSEFRLRFEDGKVNAEQREVADNNTN
jgi:hypothetical protein